MKYLLLWIVWGLVTPLFAQQEALTPTQLLEKQHPGHYKTYLQADGRYLALDTYKISKVLRHRFFVGDEIVFWVKGQRKKYKKQISTVTDSSFTFSDYNAISEEWEVTTIKLNDIRKVRVYRRIPWVTQGAYMLPLAGSIFIFTDTIVYNGRGGFDINFDPRGWLIGGGISALGILCTRASFPKYRIGKRHQFKVLRVK